MYFEELSVGQIFHLEPITVDEEAMVAFSHQFDPQKIHVDREFAERGPFGGIIASGYYTLALVWRRWVDADVMGEESLGGTGLDRVSWLAPVRAGDVLSVSATVAEARPSQKGHRGVVKFRFEAVNQAGVLVIVVEGVGLLKRRPL
jgi:acyl dehydratase